MREVNNWSSYLVSSLYSRGPWREADNPKKILKTLASKINLLKIQVDTSKYRVKLRN